MTVTWSGVIGEVCEVRVNDVFVPHTLPSVSGTRDDDSANSLIIGNNSSGSLTWDGLLDDLFIVNRVLTAAEVTEAYNNGNPYDLSGASFWSDLIAWWKMGDGDTYPLLQDSKGNNDGTMTNMNAYDITPLPLIIYSSLFAVDFDGVDDYVDCGSPAALDNIWDGGGTVGGWIYVRSDGEGNVGRVLDKNLATVGWLLNVKTESAGFVEIDFKVYFDGAADGNWDTTTAIVPINTWVHIVVTYNADAVGNDPIFYLDGSTTAIAEVTTPIGTRDTDATNNLILGNNSSGSATFDGLLDDLFIVNRILTAAEVREAYNGGNPYDLSKSSNFWTDTVAWWKMGDGDTYPTLSDSKGSNDGTMTNMTSGDIVAGVDG
jgi:hypothetical protein